MQNFEEIPNDTPLHAAIRLGNIEAVKALLDSGSNINALALYNETPLICAARYNKREIAKLLIERGANVNLTSNAGATALLFAVKENCQGVIEELLKSPNIDTSIALQNSTDYHKPVESGYTPLHAAIRLGNIEAVKALLDSGSNINALALYNETPLICAARYNKREIAKLLIERGANVNLTSSAGATALLFAVEENCQGVIEELLKSPNIDTSIALQNSTDYHKPVKSGDTPLHAAIRLGNNKNIENMLINQNLSNEKDPEKQKEILNFIKDGKQAVNFFVQYSDKAALFFQDDRIKNLIYSQISKEPSLLVCLIEKLPLTTIDGNQNYLFDLIVKTRFGFFDKLFSWFSPKYKENKTQSYFNQFIEGMEKRDTSESNFVLGKILVRGLFNVEVDAQQAGVYFQKVRESSPPEIYFDAKYELGCMCFVNSHVGIANSCFKNIVEVGENYLKQHSDKKDIEDIVSHSKNMLANQEEESKFMFFDKENKVIPSNQKIEEIIPGGEKLNNYPN